MKMGCEIQRFTSQENYPVAKRKSGYFGVEKNLLLVLIELLFVGRLTPFRSQQSL